MSTIDSSIHEAKPMISTRRPLKTRVGLFFRLWILKSFFSLAVPIVRALNVQGMGAHKPTYTKRYPVGARLVNDVWLPADYKKGETLPLFIDVHGGGFAIGDPGIDSGWCHYLANEHRFCVVSINYRKAPRFHFPYPIDDVTEIVQQVLEDPDLPVDKTKVAMGGFSAGGGLTLASNFRKEVRGRIKGLVLFYPVCDFSGRYKGEFQTASDGSPDLLLKTNDVFNYAYVPEGQDRRDPELSPVYGDRSLLPPKLLFIGAEHDILCKEAAVTAQKYAEQEGSVDRKGDENDWVAGGVTWRKVLDAQHGFNFARKRNPEAEAKRLKITDDTYAWTATWIKEQIYA